MGDRRWVFIDRWAETSGIALETSNWLWNNIIEEYESVGDENWDLIPEKHQAELIRIYDEVMAEFEKEDEQ
jgi:hypothetical protein